MKGFKIHIKEDCLLPAECPFIQDDKLHVILSSHQALRSDYYAKETLLKMGVHTLYIVDENHPNCVSVQSFIDSDSICLLRKPEDAYKLVVQVTIVKLIKK